MDSIDMLLEPLRAFLTEVGAFLPKLLLAALIGFAGWLVAKAVRFATVKALRSVNYHVLSERSGLDDFLRMGGTEADTTAIIGILVYWLVIIAALLLAANSVGLTYVTEVLAKVAMFVPRLIFAVVILTFGAYFAGFVDSTVTGYGRRVGLDEAPVIGGLARYGVLLFVILIALDQLQIGGDIIRETFLIVLAGIVLAVALAFGLGGRDWAAHLLEHWLPKREDKPSDDESPPTA